MSIIETERLILRRWREGDFQPFARMNVDPRVMEYMPRLLTPEATMAFIERISKFIDDHGYGLFACELKATGKFMGYVGLSIPNFKTAFTPCVEIGWRLAFEYWDKGYATEAARAVLKFGFEEVGLSEILSWTVPENGRSRRIMEKIGMKNDLAESFKHPMVPEGDSRSWHVLYRIARTS